MNVPVEVVKELEEEENDTTYFFKEDEHAKCLLENLGEMQANGGLLTDVVVSTGSKDYGEKFHSILLAACSPVVKKHLVKKSSISSEERITLQEMTKEMLEFIRRLIYESKVILDKDILNLDDLHNFAVKYDIDFLQETCEKCKDTDVGSPQMEVEFHGHEDMLLELFQMFQEKELTTTVLEDNEGKTQFDVHGPLIAAASPMLKEALLKVASAGGTKKIRLRISSAALGDLIEYIYTAKVTLRSQNVFGLLEAACTYQFPALAKVCCDWLIAGLDTYHDVVSILYLVRNLDSGYTRGLEEAVKNYIVLNFRELSAGEEFNSLWYDDLKEVIEDDKLDVETEEDVFGVVMGWIEFDENSRLPLICDILPSIRLEKTSFEFLDAVEDDPRIGNCPRCRQELDWARQKLDLAEDESSSSSTVTEEDHYEQVSRAACDDTSSFLLSDATFLKEDDGYSSVSGPLYGRPKFQDCLRDDSDYQPSETSLRKDGRPDMRFKENRELFLEKGRNKNGRPDKRLRENKGKATDPLKRNSTSDMPHRDDEEDLDDTSSHHFSEGLFLDDYDNFSSVSGPDYRRCLPHDSLSDSYQPRDTGLRKDVQPDLRFKEHRELYLEEETSRNGAPDQRLKENRAVIPGPLKKDGTRDMRYKVNREAFSQKERTAEFPFTPTDGQRLGPMKKNGTPDMRFKVNKEALRSAYPRRSFSTSVREMPPVTPSFPSESPYSSGCYAGPQKKDGTPDMRYVVNLQLYGTSQPLTRSVPRGPLKKNGAPDMRYAVNKQLYGACSVSNSVPRGPLKKNGAPDMRYAVNKEPYGACAVSNSVPRGPLKKNGTPDMRYAANKQAYGLAPPSPVARGPLKKNGTPDMRFKANKR